VIESQGSLGEAETLGHMVGLCALQGVYSNWTIEDVRRLFVPPVLARQCKVYFRSGRCCAFVTWALVSADLSQRIRCAFEDPPPGEWTSGDELWIIDLVAVDCAAAVARDLQRSVFAGRRSKAHALRRDRAGVVRKIAQWPSAGRIEPFA
jgi:cytolysin-activating lysine-acyltransferase